MIHYLVPAAQQGGILEYLDFWGRPLVDRMRVLPYEELPGLRRLLRAREYHTTLYEVVWRDTPRSPDPWNTRYFRPEVSLL